MTTDQKHCFLCFEEKLFKGFYLSKIPITPLILMLVD